MSRRPRGILSPKDRDYLRGESELSDAGERMARRRIRERVRHAFLDFALLYHYLEPRDREQILFGSNDETPARLITHNDEFEVPELEWDLVDPLTFEEVVFTGGLRHMHAFAYLCLFDVFGSRISPVISALVEEGCEDMFGKVQVPMKTEVMIEVFPQDIEIETLRERYEMGEVTDNEVEWLIHLRELEYEEMVDYVRNNQREAHES